MIPLGPKFVMFTIKSVGLYLGNMTASLGRLEGLISH